MNEKYKRRISIEAYFTVPYDVEELFSGMHGSIDPDSGHIVCHKYSPRVGIIGNGEESIPYIAYGDCIGIVVGDRIVGKLLSILDARQVEHLEIKQSSGLIAKVDSSEVSVEDLVIALHRLRVLGYNVTKIYMGSTSDQIVPIIVGIDKENRREMIAVFVEPGCIKSSGKGLTLHM
ncbi:MAG: hypothetical protein DRO40_12185 [Thermoprotei archaeon]|nr:MAG: hypothetical protein DRO40_12185 [Thermoprotei archaeon]